MALAGGRKAKPAQETVLRRENFACLFFLLLSAPCDLWPPATFNNYLFSYAQGREGERHRTRRVAHNVIVLLTRNFAFSFSLSQPIFNLSPSSWYFCERKKKKDQLTPTHQLSFLEDWKRLKWFPSRVDSAPGEILKAISRILLRLFRSCLVSTWSIISFPDSCSAQREHLKTKSSHRKFALTSIMQTFLSRDFAKKKSTIHCEVAANFNLKRRKLRWNVNAVDKKISWENSCWSRVESD